MGLFTFVTVSSLMALFSVVLTSPLLSIHDDPVPSLAVAERELELEQVYSDAQEDEGKSLLR